VFRAAVLYAVSISVLHLLARLNRRIAHGRARPIDLAQEVVVITGGASGLGLLLAEVYGLRGVSVAVLDVRAMPGEARGVRFYECDVGDGAAVRAVAARIEAELGAVSILVNNAGVAWGKGILELSEGEIDR
jgi:NAD(P)-dependent dehydrogenase (short-subunit alcohol dehydrogenase family)